jgi:hypothetical protein
MNRQSNLNGTGNTGNFAGVGGEGIGGEGIFDEEH